MGKSNSVASIRYGIHVVDSWHTRPDGHNSKRTLLSSCVLASIVMTPHSLRIVHYHSTALLGDTERECEHNLDPNPNPNLNLNQARPGQAGVR